MKARKKTNLLNTISKTQRSQQQLLKNKRTIPQRKILVKRCNRALRRVSVLSFVTFLLSLTPLLVTNAISVRDEYGFAIKKEEFDAWQAEKDHASKKVRNFL